MRRQRPMLADLHVWSCAPARAGWGQIFAVRPEAGSFSENFSFQQGFRRDSSAVVPVETAEAAVSSSFLRC